MLVRISRVSSKGQIVIPQVIRAKLKIKEGDLFLFIPLSHDLILLKRISFDTEDYKKFTEELVEELKKLRVQIKKEIIDKALKNLIKKYQENE